MNKPKHIDELVNSPMQISFFSSIFRKFLSEIHSELGGGGTTWIIYDFRLRKVVKENGRRNKVRIGNKKVGEWR